MIPRPHAPRVRRSSIILALTVAALAFPLGVLATHQFSDVPTGASFHDDVQALVEAGVTSGCGDGKYCPSNNVTRGQMAQFLNRLGNLDGNSTPSVDAATLNGLDYTAFAQPLFAVVNADGTLARGTSGTSVEVSGADRIVRFNRNVRDCAYTGTVGLSGASGTADAGSINVVGANADVNGVYVEMFDGAGTETPQPFHLVVMCDGPAGATLSESGPTVSGDTTDNQPSSR